MVLPDSEGLALSPRVELEAGGELRGTVEAAGSEIWACGCWVVPPFQGGNGVVGRVPRALPWAIAFGPVGAATAGAWMVDQACVGGLACVGGVGTAGFAGAPTGPEEIAQGKALG